MSFTQDIFPSKALVSSEQMFKQYNTSFHVFLVFYKHPGSRENTRKMSKSLATKTFSRVLPTSRVFIKKITQTSRYIFLNICSVFVCVRLVIIRTSDRPVSACFRPWPSREILHSLDQGATCSAEGCRDCFPENVCPCDPRTFFCLGN